MLCISLAIPQVINSPVIQLAGLEKRCQGAVQVQMENTWYSLCETALNNDLSARICRMLNCGEPILQVPGQELNGSLPFLNVTCGMMEDIRNCSFLQVAEDECGGAAFLNCTDPVLRLSGSHGPCAGRLEVFMDGVWGSVCPDGWDARDAEVTCQQMNCGSALSSWTGSFFGRGPPHIHLNGADCRGSEDSLWECPASRRQDCSTGEHAGVICAAHRAVRLSGGEDRCSGRVEVYLHGVWATVCDTHWYEDDSIILCKYLGCGSFRNQTKHEHSLIYAAVICHKAKTLQDCKVYKQKAHICDTSEAVGLICQAGAMNDSRETESTTIGVTNSPAPGFTKVHIDLQYLVIACAVLTALLLASIFIFSVIILRLQRQKKISIQNASLPRSNERWNSREDKQPDFSLQISPMCPSPRLKSKEPVPAAIPLVPTITTTLEDEEDYGFSSAPLMPLVTFHEEKRTQEVTTARAGDGKKRRRLRSANSERSSSTSSEEQNWYENYRQQVGPQNFLSPPQPYDGSSEYDDVSSVASD